MKDILFDIIKDYFKQITKAAPKIMPTDKETNQVLSTKKKKRKIKVYDKKQ